MKVVIIGCGLVGLTAAISLVKQGHSVKVLERHGELWAIGGAINLTIGGSRVLNDLGLHEKLAPVSDNSNLVYLRDLLSGSVSRAAPVSNGSLESRTIMRPNLLKLLYAEALQLGVNFEFGSTVSDVAEWSNSATVTLNDGSTQTADLVIAADGVRSRMRTKILKSFVSDPSQLEAVQSDRTYYLMKLTPEDMKGLEEDLRSSIGSSILFTPNCLNFWSGGESRYCLSIYNPSGNNLSVLYSLREPTEMTALWDDAGDVNYVRDKFAGRCHPELQHVLSAAQSCERWRLSQMPDLPHWRSQSGRLVLLGDAAHAMHPTAGQGFSTAAEEISVLSYLLQTYPNNVEEATRRWEEICKPRSNRIKHFANFLSHSYEGDYDSMKQVAKGSAAEEKLKKTDPHLDSIEGDMHADFMTPEFMKWLRGYNVLTTAKSMN